MFPRRRWFGPFHAAALPALSVLASVTILILVGSLLGFLPGGIGGRGWFQGSQTGAPVIEAALGALSVAFFGVAWWRGAFPLLSRRRRRVAFRPRSAPEDWIERGEPEEMTTLRDLRLEEERLRKEALRVRKRARESKDPGVRLALSEAADDLERRRTSVANRARETERVAAERRYG